MIIFGTRGLTSVAGTGVFHCPRCGPQRTYSHKRVNRWFTLYFIPVLPIGSAGEYVECEGCAGTFGPEVLHYNPEEERRQIIDQVKRILILAAMAHGPADDSKVASVQAAYAGLTDIHIMPEEIWQEIELANQAGAKLIPYAQHVATQFNDSAKNMLLAGVGTVLSYDGSVTALDEQVLLQLAAAMGMTRNAADAVLQQIRSS